MQLFNKIISCVEDSKVEVLRKNFLRGFFGYKLLEPVSKCPIDCMFWDWLFSYYPDNDISPIRYSLFLFNLYRFAKFSREYLTFLLDHKRFVQCYLDWIQKNDCLLISYATTSCSIPKLVTAAEIKFYADVHKEILKEKLFCVLFINELVYRLYQRLIFKNMRLLL